MSRFVFGSLTSGGLDGNDFNTISLLHLDTVGSFPDVNGAGISRTWSTGGASIDTSSHVFGAGSLLSNNSSLSTPADAAILALKTSDFTIDCWAACSGSPSDIPFNFWCFQFSNGGFPAASVNLSFIPNSTHVSQPFKFRAALQSSLTAPIYTGVTVNDGAYRHYAAVRNGSTLTFYMNGVSQGSVSYSSSSSTTTDFVIGGGGGASPAPGQRTDEFRISKIARWTSNFTPPVRAYS